MPLNAISDYAADVDVNLAVQPMSQRFCRENTFLHTLDETLDLIDACDHPALGIAFDLFHLWQELNLLARIREITPLVSVLQVSDWKDPVANFMEKCLPGEGDIPVDLILQTFHQAGYSGFVELNLSGESIWETEDSTDIVSACRRWYQTVWNPNRVFEYHATS